MDLVSASVIKNKNEISIQKNLITLFCVKMMTSFASAVLYSSLNLYLVTELNFGERHSADIIGIFLGLGYLLPLIGGYIGNHLINFKYLFYLGSTIQIIGCIALAFSSYTGLYLALSIFLAGSIGSQICNIMFLTETVKNNEALKQRAMLWNYCGMNVGFLVGFVSSGFVALHCSYKYLFLFISIMTIISMLIVYYFLKYERKPTDQSKITIFLSVLCCFLLVFIFDLIFQFSDKIRWTLIITSLAGIIHLLFYAFFEKKEHRNNLFKLIFFIFIAISYWIIYFLSPSVLMDLIRTHTNLQIAQLTIAPQWLETIDPICVILGTSFFAIFLKGRKKTAQPMKTTLLFSIGLISVLIGLCLITYVMENILPFGKISPFVIMVYFFMISLGSVFVGPESLNLASKLAPKNLQGLTTGITLAMLGISSIIASMIADHILKNSKIVPISSYIMIFEKLTMFIIIILSINLVIGFYLENKS